MSTKKEAVIIVVITFLLVILIYSSVAKFEVFARPPATASSCVETKPTRAGAVIAERCCTTTTHFNDAGQPAYSATTCDVCDYGGGGSRIGCNTVGVRQGPSPPPPLTNALPPSSTLQQTTPTTCPNGLAPDANGNCPGTSSTTTFHPPLSPLTNTKNHGGSNNNNNNNAGANPIKHCSKTNAGGPHCPKAG